MRIIFGKVGGLVVTTRNRVFCIFPANIRFLFSRNVVILFGIGFGLGSASLVFLFTPLYVLFNVWELRRIEEPELVKRLGEEYIEYRRRTPMFFPRP